MSALEEYLTLIINNEKTLIVVLLAMLAGLLWRAYRMQYGTTLHSLETAGKTVLRIIAVMIFLSFCYNSSQLLGSERVKDFLWIISMIAYFIIAAIQSADDNCTGWNLLLSPIKFLMVFLFAISGKWLKLAFSVLLAGLTVIIWCKWEIEEDRAKVRLAEIFFCCIGNIILTIVLFFCHTLDQIFTDIVYIVFEETVMYSLNDFALALYKDALGLPITENE